jgi:hypothetical protein
MRDNNTLHDALLEKARTLPPADLPDFLGRLEVVRITAMSRITSPVETNETLDAKETAKRLGISRAHFYNVYKKYPFVTHEGGKVVASASGLKKYQEAKRK